MVSQGEIGHQDVLTETEALLKARFNPKSQAERKQRMLTSDGQASVAARSAALMLPDSDRPRMPLTKEEYIVKENDDLVLWEREVRKFLARIGAHEGHRVSAVMIYEWATGIKVADLKEAGGSMSDLRKLNKVLRYYFGKPYMTYICGRKVPSAYRVPKGFFIRRRRPMTLTLFAEYLAGTLTP